MVEFYIAMTVNSYITNLSISNLKMDPARATRVPAKKRLLARTSQASVLSEYSEKSSR